MFTTHSTQRFLSRYVVHYADCPHVGRKARTDFTRIPNLATRIAVGSVRACQHCTPDLSTLPKEEVT